MGRQGFSKLTFKPRKSLGQNFLTSPLHLAKIVSACQINNASNVIEIGAGYGALTHYILEVNPYRVISIEKDRQLFSWLHTNFSFTSKKLSLLLADALEVKWEELLSSLPNSRQQTIIVGNLPYNIANQLVSKLVRQQQFFRRLVFLVQKEVAQRWVANHRSYKNKYSALSIMLNYFYRVELVFEVPKYFFRPQPPVDGAVVVFESREDLLTDLPTERFFTFTRNCFRFRRKTLLNNLKSFHGKE